MILNYQTKKTIRPLLLLILILCIVMTIGCATVDNWPIFQPDYDKLLKDSETRPIKIPDEATPGMAEPPTLEMPPPGKPMDLSVEQTVLMSLRHNRDLHVRELNPVIAGTFEMIERGFFDPELFASFQYDRIRATETSRATGEQFSSELSDNTSIGGIRQLLPTGTDLEATIEHDDTRSNRSPDQQTARVGISITQSLLRGFGPAVNMVGISQAELEHTASLYELRGYTEALVADTEIAYWNFVLATREIAIFENALEVARQQRDETEEQINVGLMPRTEAAAARAEVALRKQALIDAQSQLEARRLRLVRLIGPGPAGRLELKIKTTTEPELDPQPVKNLTERLLLAEQSRPDMNEARLRLRQDRLETIVTRNGLLPRLELFAALGQTGYADTFSNAFSDLESDTNDFSAGIRFSHYLGNRTAEARDRAARATSRQSSEALQNLLQLVRLDVHLAANELERSRRQITATTATRTLQEQALQAEQERYEVGASTSLLVAQAQRDLLAAQIAEVEAIINYRIALVELYLSEGSLLERRGIRLD